MLQAITTLATLATLVASPAIGRSQTPSSPAILLSDRVWILLEAAVEEDDHAPDRVKLDNIADEVIKALAVAAKVDTLPLEKEKEMRNTIDRMVRLEDPVYRLLSRRLLQAFTDAFHNRTPVMLPKGFSVSPLATQIARCFTAIKDVLDWTAEAWPDVLT